MNVRAERLDNESIRYIYKTYMKKDFPRSELKPLKSILAPDRERQRGMGMGSMRECTGRICVFDKGTLREGIPDRLSGSAAVCERQRVWSACLLALQSILDKRDMYSDKEAVRENEGYIIMQRPKTHPLQPGKRNCRSAEEESAFTKKMDFLIPGTPAASLGWNTEF